MDDYLVDFATLLTEGADYRFILDNGRVLWPSETVDYKGTEGERVILSYTPLQGDTIEVKAISALFTGKIQDEGYPEKYADDPIKLVSVWVGGGYLNLIMEVEYHSQPHSLALLRDPLSPSTDLWLSHSRNNDPPGYRQRMYASFNLLSLHNEGESLAIPFRLFIATSEGVRQFSLTLPSS